METYTVVRVHGLIQHLLSPRDYEALINGRGLWEYPEYAHVEPEDDVPSMLTKVGKVLIERLEFLSSLESGYRRFIRAFSDRLELENIKIKLRELHRAREKYDIYAQYSHHIPLEELLGISEEESFWRKLEGTPYHSLLATEDLKGKSLQFKEAYLDSCYYAYFKGSLNRRERKTLGRFIDLEGLIPAAYWMIVLGEKEVTPRLEGEFKGFRTEFSRIEEYSLRAVLGELGIGWDRAGKLVRESKISALIREALVNHLGKVKDEARRRRLSLAYVYYYLLLAKYERDNLQRVIVGRSLELDREKILQTLILP